MQEKNEPHRRMWLVFTLTALSAVIIDLQIRRTVDRFYI
jgi:hypothetical protein